MYVKENRSFNKGRNMIKVTTQGIAEVLGIQRTNSSKDLNQLVREGETDKDRRTTSTLHISNTRYARKSQLQNM